MNKLKVAAAFLIGTLIPMTSTGQDLTDTKLSTKTVLNIAVVKEVAAAAEAEALKNGWNVSIAIVDDAGQLLYFQRMDDVANSSADIAIAKAKHAANYRRDTKFHQTLLENGNNVVLALPDSMPIEGGVRLMAGNKVIGGIGVSGAQSPEDGQIAQAGADLLKNKQ